MQQMQQMRVRAHLTRAETRLRRRRSNDTPESFQRRTVQAERLSAYRKAGQFPQNTYTTGQTPVFVDAAGTRCAVGHLLHVDNQDHVVQAVVDHDLFVNVEDFTPELSGTASSWAETHGMDMDDLAAIQPSYWSNMSATYGYMPSFIGVLATFLFTWLTYVAARITLVSVQVWNENRQVAGWKVNVVGAAWLTLFTVPFTLLANYLFLVPKTLDWLSPRKKWYGAIMEWSPAIGEHLHLPLGVRYSTLLAALIITAVVLSVLKWSSSKLSFPKTLASVITAAAVVAYAAQFLFVLIARQIGRFRFKEVFEQVPIPMSVTFDTVMFYGLPAMLVLLTFTISVGVVSIYRRVTDDSTDSFSVPKTLRQGLIVGFGAATFATFVAATQHLIGTFYGMPI